MPDRPSIMDNFSTVDIDKNLDRYLKALEQEAEDDSVRRCLQSFKDEIIGGLDVLNDRISFLETELRNLQHK